MAKQTKISNIVFLCLCIGFIDFSHLQNKFHHSVLKVGSHLSTFPRDVKEITIISSPQMALQIDRKDVIIPWLAYEFLPISFNFQKKVQISIHPSSKNSNFLNFLAVVCTMCMRALYISNIFCFDGNWERCFCTVYIA